MMEEMHLTDVWRVRNPDSKRYSWYRAQRQPAKDHTNHQVSASRIDYGLISIGLSSMVHDVFYFDGMHTDHSAYFIGFELQKLDRGSGYWKLNTSHLSNPDFVQKINENIAEKIVQYEGLKAIEKWILLKGDIKKKCIELSRRQASDDSVAMSQLIDVINEYESRIDMLENDELEILIKSKEDLESLSFKKTKGVMFRSKARWYMEGEKSTRYFYNLEKSKYNAKTCTTLITGTGEIVKKPQDILQLQQEFYQELYTSDPTVHFNISPDVVGVNVTADKSATSELAFTYEEIREAVKSLKNGSCPGADGLPIEVYKIFWKEIKVILCEAIGAMYEHGIPEQSKIGILNLIPKGDKDTRYLKNLSRY